MGLLSGINYHTNETLIEEVKKINKRLDKIEKKLEEQKDKEQLLNLFKSYYSESVEIPDACKHCSNHPNNGGSGICHCTVPYLSKTGVTY